MAIIKFKDKIHTNDEGFNISSRINMLIGFNLNTSFLFRKSPLKNILNWKGMVYVRKR